MGYRKFIAAIALSAILLTACARDDQAELRGSLYFAAGNYLALLDLRDGSLLELAWRGTRPIPMPDGSERKFLLDGDTVILRGCCTAPHFRVGFGECAGQILPAAGG